MVVPRFVNQALNDEPLPVYGDGQQRRSFTWVGDAVRAIVQLSQEPEAVGQVFNIGHGKDISIYALAELIKERTNSASEIQLIPYEEAYAEGFEDMQRRVPDITKIQKQLGYEPTLDLPEILDHIIAEQLE
jgi:UDP-glucose 4-epimerase